MSKGKEYWLVLEPHVYFVTKQTVTILYNTLSGNLFEVRNPILIKLFKAKHIKISETDLQRPIVRKLINKLISLEMGDLIDIKLNGSCKISVSTPLIMPFKKTNKTTIYNQTENAIGNLSDLFIYINNQCKLSCKFCKTAFKQFPACTKILNEKSEISFSFFPKIIEEIKEINLRSLNILGGNIFSYSDFDGLLTFLRKVNITQYFYLHSIHAIENLQKIDSLFNSNYPRFLNLYIDFENDCKSIAQIIKNFTRWKDKIYYEFFVEKADNLFQIYNVIESYDISKYKITPVYTGENMAFFEENVFITKKHILHIKNDLTDIMLKDRLNPLNFGKLYINCDLDVFTNLNSHRVGTLFDTTLNEIINNEIKNGVHWIISRNRVKPCKSCVYSFICPPISNYEYVFGRFNLCNL